MYAALFPGPHLRNLILYATPIDCSPENLGGFRWITTPGVHPEWLAGLFGNVPPEFVGSTPRLLKLITDHLGTLLGRGNRLSQDPSLATWIALNQWVSEGIPFAGEAFRQMTHDLIQHNKLVKGEFQLRGRPVDLKNITCSLLSIAGTQDIICRVPQAEAIMHLASSQDKGVLRAGGRAHRHAGRCRSQARALAQGPPLAGGPLAVVLLKKAGLPCPPSRRSPGSGG
jgi:polyhydroxyalkanoate synthase